MDNVGTGAKYLSVFRLMESFCLDNIDLPCTTLSHAMCLGYISYEINKSYNLPCLQSKRIAEMRKSVVSLICEHD